MSKYHGQHWDIFCNIVDNYGDIGICWRLSQQLVNDHHVQVRLFIDNLTTAKKIIPHLDSTLTEQAIQGVTVCTWPIVATMPAEVVIETFSCALPDAYLVKMTQQQSIWINLEYLSAESWVGDFHAKPSPHPTLAITKHFYFPGFKNDTGGLIREHNLIAKRDTFLNSKIDQTKFWQALGINNESEKDSIKISLFYYPQANINQLLLALSATNQPSSIFLPFNGSIDTLSSIFTDFKQVNANTLRLESITVHLLPFLSQSDYDHLLWACDLNFVRGEDSWIRAIWASKPFIWQPYIQTEDTHIKKMQAFLEVYSCEATDEIKSTLLDAHLTWSNASISDTNNLTRLVQNLPKLDSYTKQQADILSALPDLATKLLSFSEKLAKNKV
jgi:uncharacterized repeat protein (TIGR03837 family)